MLPDTIVAARVPDLPDTRRRAVHRSASQREDESLRTTLNTAYSRWCSAAGSGASYRFGFMRATVQGLARFRATSHAVIRSRTSTCLRCPEEGGLDETRRAVTFVRTKWGVSDPRRSGPGTASGGWQRGSLTPHITLISHPRGFGGGEERRLDHQHGASRSRGSSMTCHATPPLELVRGVRVHRCLPLGGQGEHCSRVCVPPPAPPLSAPGGAAVVLF